MDSSAPDLAAASEIEMRRGVSFMDTLYQRMARGESDVTAKILLTKNHIVFILNLYEI